MMMVPMMLAILGHFRFGNQVLTEFGTTLIDTYSMTNHLCRASGCIREFTPLHPGIFESWHAIDFCMSACQPEKAIMLPQTGVKKAEKADTSDWATECVSKSAQIFKHLCLLLLLFVGPFLTFLPL